MRHRYLVSYDVTDNKRRSRLFKLLLGYGEHVQYSVFLADLSHSECVTLKSRIMKIIDLGDDQCLLVRFGRETRPLEEKLEVLGVPYAPPKRPFIV